MREIEIWKAHLLRKHFSDSITNLLTVVFRLSAHCRQKWKLVLSLFFPMDLYFSLTLHTRQPSFVPDLIRKSHREIQSAQRKHIHSTACSLLPDVNEPSLPEQHKRIYCLFTGNDRPLPQLHDKRIHGQRRVDNFAVQQFTLDSQTYSVDERRVT